MPDIIGGDLSDNFSIDLFSVLRKRWWIIVLCVAVASGLFFLKQFTKKSQYESSVLLTIRSKNFQTSYSNPEMASAYLKGDSAVSEIMGKLNLNKDKSAEISEKINVAPVGDFLKIHIIDSDPKLARDLANAAGETLRVKAYDVTRKKLELLQKRVFDIDKSLEESDKLNLKLTEKIMEALSLPNLTENERVMLSAWQAQILSNINQATAQQLREKHELKLQINNIQEGVPQITKAMYPKKLSRGLKSSIAMGILVGIFAGVIIAVWLEFWRQKKR